MQSVFPANVSEQVSNTWYYSQAGSVWYFCIYQSEAVKLITVPFFRQYLPHWRPLGALFFLTYWLAGTLPRRAIDDLERERQRLQALPLEHGCSEDERNIHIDKKLFALWDEYLGKHADVKWLADPRIANIVRDNLYYHAGKTYSLWAYVIMSNHVHVLLQPDEGTTCRRLVDSTTSYQPVQNRRSRSKKGPLSAILHSLRSYTANEANKVLSRTGAFWRSEVYDHWVRNDTEFQRIIHYIENNPVKAGLVEDPEDWRFSSAYDRIQSGIGPFDRLA